MSDAQEIISIVMDGRDDMPPRAMVCIMSRPGARAFFYGDDPVSDARRYATLCYPGATVKERGL